MIRGTTPKHTFKLPIDTDLIKSIKVMYAQKDKVILTKRKDDCEMSGNSVTVSLSQEDTFLFCSGEKAQIQIRALTTSDNSLISRILTTTVEKCLDNEVLV